MFIPLTKQAEGLNRAVAEEQEESDADDDQDFEAYNRLAQRMWIAYYIHARRKWDSTAEVLTEVVEYSILLHSGKILQEYLADFYAQTEAWWLRYLALNLTRS
jgi:Tat protein secretion system quality control protein TatD with DNase activity